MAIRSRLANSMLQGAIGFGEMLRCKRVVELDQHSINIRMDVPKKSDKAWDSNLYHNGLLCVKGYANPIKAYVWRYKKLENKDLIDVEEEDGDVEWEDGDAHVGERVAIDGKEGEKHVELISSTRYALNMKNKLVSDLLNPMQKLERLIWVAIGILIAVVANLILTGVAFLG